MRVTTCFLTLLFWVFSTDARKDGDPFCHKGYCAKFCGKFLFFPKWCYTIDENRDPNEPMCSESNFARCEKGANCAGICDAFDWRPAERFPREPIDENLPVTPALEDFENERSLGDPSGLHYCHRGYCAKYCGDGGRRTKTYCFTHDGRGSKVPCYESCDFDWGCFGPCDPFEWSSLPMA